MIGRRKFFGIAGAAAIGGKRVATDVLSEMSIGAPVPGYAFGGLAQAAQATGPGDYITSLQTRAAKVSMLRATGFSSAVRDYLRQWNGNGRVNLDDINSLVSVSVSAKKRMVRERLEEQEIADWFDRPARELKRRLAEKEFGISL